MKNKISITIIMLFSLLIFNNDIVYGKETDYLQIFKDGLSESINLKEESFGGYLKNREDIDIIKKYLISTGENGESTLIKDSNAAEYFRIKSFGSYQTHVVIEDGFLKLTVYGNRFDSEEDEKYIEVEYDKIEKIIKEKIKEYELREGKKITDYELLRIINNYIVDRFSYSYTSPIGSTHSVSVMLKGNQGVCQAYALIAYDILNRFGFEVDFVFGQIPTKEYHVWVGVKIGGNWYNYDPTWNDPIGYDSVTSGRDSYGQSIRESYLLLTNNEIEASRLRISNFISSESSFNSLNVKEYNYENYIESKKIRELAYKNKVFKNRLINAREKEARQM